MFYRKDKLYNNKKSIRKWIDNFSIHWKIKDKINWNSPSFKKPQPLLKSISQKFCRKVTFWKILKSKVIKGTNQYLNSSLTTGLREKSQVSQKMVKFLRRRRRWRSCLNHLKVVRRLVNSNRRKRLGRS
jgi:hypothetical protein